MANYTDEEMKRFGEHVENYVEEFFESIILPEDDDEYDVLSKRFKEAKKRSMELAKKLKEGKRSVFIDDD